MNNAQFCFAAVANYEPQQILLDISHGKRLVTSDNYKRKYTYVYLLATNDPRPCKCNVYTVSERDFNFNDALEQTFKWTDFAVLFTAIR